jgi:AcrR family transcriptional regulator
VASPIPNRRQNVRGQAAQAAVLAAATQLFAERGYAGTSLGDIAAASGVGKPSVLYHYPDKDSLWKATVETLWTEVDLFYQSRWPNDLRPSRLLLERILELFVEAAVTWPAYIRIPFIEGATPSWRSEWLVDRHFRQHVLTTDRVVRALQARGQLPAGDPAHFQAIMTSTVNVLMAQGAMWDRAYGRPIDGVESLRGLIRLTLDLMLGPADDHAVHTDAAV